jgi:UDP:flavonoid glycosyltransferase YjiC (YdhE family)
MQRLDWIPTWLRRGLSSLSTRLILDPIVLRPVNAFRAQIGLPPTETWMSAWRGEPALAIGLFPQWFAPYPPESPERTRLTGFVSYCGEEVQKTPKKLTDFLDAGPAPLVFTAGTVNNQATIFFATAVEAAQRIGRRAVLLTPFREQVPAELPDGIVQIDYAPLSQFLQRAAAVVHHGGIGTLAQALAAGIPQLIIPHGFDQPANALRVRDLGAGDYLPIKRADARALSEKLASLLDDEPMRSAARRYGAKIAEQDALAETADLVEKLGEGRFPTAAVLEANAMERSPLAGGIS